MLNNVKSYYIIEIFFSYLEEKQKLKLVKNNKNLQKYLNITINNYIHFKGKYIIYEGEYLNGKRNGTGKEYEIDNLIFEGEYLNGERNGKGKEYNYENKLTYDGEYLNGKRNGKGKEYNYGTLIYHYYNILFLFHFFYHLNIPLHIVEKVYMFFLFL